MSSHLAGPLTIKVRRPRALRAAHACALIARDLPARQDELDGAAATDKSPEERAPHARTDALVPTEKIAGKKRCATVIDNSEAKEVMRAVMSKWSKYGMNVADIEFCALHPPRAPRRILPPAAHSPHARSRYRRPPTPRGAAQAR